MNGRIGDEEILLASGGDADDSSPIDEWLLKRVGDDATMGYVPVALPPERYPDCERWITEIQGESLALQRGDESGVTFDKPQDGAHP